jgi:hypothetical protein
MMILGKLLVGALTIYMGIVALTTGGWDDRRYSWHFDFTGTNKIGAYLFIVIGLGLIGETLYMEYQKRKK